MPDSQSKRYEAFGRRLGALMKAAGMNQTELAAAVDVSPSFVSKMRAGTDRPSYDTLVLMARVLNADLDELAYLTGYSAGAPADRPDLPGWVSLDPDDQAQVRALVVRLAELTEAGGERTGRAASAPPTNPLRDRDQVELEAIAASLPAAGRAALLDTARALQSMAHALDEPPRQEREQPDRTADQGTA